MKDQETKSLTGQSARIVLTNGEEIVVTFGEDTELEWAAGRNLHSNETPILHPEITGHMETKEDYSHIQDAELILHDQRVFKISFVSPTYFSAHESINSRTQVLEA